MKDWAIANGKAVKKKALKRVDSYEDLVTDVGYRIAEETRKQNPIWKLE